MDNPGIVLCRPDGSSNSQSADSRISQAFKEFVKNKSNVFSQ